MRLHEAEVIDDDLRIRIAADELDALVEPPGDMQVGRQGVPRGRCQHLVEARICRVGGKAAAHEQHADTDGARRAFPIRDNVRDARIGRVHRLDEREPAGMALVHLERIARVVPVHCESGDQDCSGDTGHIHLRHHLIARNLRWTREDAVPGPAGVISLVSMHLRVDSQNFMVPPQRRAIRAAREATI